MFEFRIIIIVMERRKTIDLEKQNNLKLPSIHQHPKPDTSRILSSTMPENGRGRPSSLRKVEDLERKLFDKIDSYETVARKGMKRQGKKRVEGQNSNERPMEGY